jgi:uncharacterized surface anchored protein
MEIRMKTVLVLAASLLLSVSASAGTDNKNEKRGNESKSVTLVENVNVIQLTGSVVDEKNKEALAGATIVIEGKKYYSDLDGNFSIRDVKPGSYRLLVELISYEPVSMQVDLMKNERLHISLFQK